MPKMNIVVADGICGPGVDLLKEAFGEDALEIRGKYAPDELLEAIPNMDVLLIRSGTTVPREAIEKAGKRLKLIGRAGVGTDNIDKKAATEKGIIVMNTPLGNTVSAAEQAIALLFASARNTARADHTMQSGTWDKKNLVGVEVYGKILGLIGMGKIGGHVARVMRAAGMTVVAYDPFLSADRAKELGVELVDLDTLLAQADFISLHTPLTDATRNLLNRENLEKTKPTVRIVNCARGGIIDEPVLAEMVASGRIAGAALDVFSKEPMTEGPLFGVKNLLLTPHLGASTEEAEDRCGQQMAEQVIAYMKDGVIKNAVNVDMACDASLRPFVQTAMALGQIGATLLGVPAEKVEVACSGDFLAERDTSEITAATVLGVMRCYSPEDANLINAKHLAHERGITIGSATGHAGGVYANRIDVVVSGGGKGCHVAGTAFGEGSARLIQLDDAELDTRIGTDMLFLRYPDQPGYVGTFGTLIAEHGINIANMEVGSLESRKRASMVIGLSSAAPQPLLDALLKVEGVEKALYVSLA